MNKKTLMVLMSGFIVFFTAAMSYGTMSLIYDEPVLKKVTDFREEELYTSPSLAITREEPEIFSTKISVVGDLMVHNYQYNNAYNNSSKTYNFDYCFERITLYLTDADYTIGNLETVFAGEKVGYSDYPCFNTPDAFADSLKKAGFDLLTTANNHCNDKGEQGIIRTIDKLTELGISNIGTYKSQEEQNTIFIKEINNIKFAFLSYTYGTNGIPLTQGKPYLANIMDEELIKTQILKAKELNPDFIIVFPHMGNEYETAPNEIFINWVNFMFDSGADIVLASHPHVLQPVLYKENINDDLTISQNFAAYSMGNFISSQRTFPRDAGAIFNLYFEKIEGKKAVLKDVSFIPTWVKFINLNGQYDIKVLSVFDALKEHNNNVNVDLRSVDINRLKKVHKETTGLLLNEDIPLEEIKNEYFLNILQQEEN